MPYSVKKNMYGVSNRIPVGGRPADELSAAAQKGPSAQIYFKPNNPIIQFQSNTVQQFCCHFPAEAPGARTVISSQSHTIPFRRKQCLGLGTSGYKDQVRSGVLTRIEGLYT